MTTRPCAGCGKSINDHKDVRFTIKGVRHWYCSRRCASTYDEETK